MILFATKKLQCSSEYFISQVINSFRDCGSCARLKSGGANRNTEIRWQNGLISRFAECITCVELLKSNLLKLSKRCLSRGLLPDLPPYLLRQQQYFSSLKIARTRPPPSRFWPYIVKYASSPCTWGGWRSIHAGAIIVKPCVCCSISEKTGHFSTLGKLYGNF